ncbi:MAG: hypothetical protein BWK73_36705 [Thiothrix lacustris]|uniref:HPt domain-containing protein n=1 Tax=Thiothrix lacustris TaxID=525917 RepID=A0A1Y1QFN3_9GAMM|nr:MAG: hypothetical protein BWK73_36705 [Thiothrix lacustris]
MAGAFALGDFGWIHEDLLNHVLNGQVVADDRVVEQVGKAIVELQARLPYFLEAQQKDARVEEMIAAAEAVLLPPEAAPLEMFDFSAPTPAHAPAKMVTPLPILELPLEPIPEPILELPLEPIPAPILELPPEPIPEEPIAALPALLPAFTLPPDPEPEPDDAAEMDAEARLIWQLFWEEVPEQLQALDRNLQHLRDAPDDQDIIHELEREFHTLKGGARMAQLTALADVSHEAESLLSRLHHVSGVSAADIETLQVAVDRLHHLAEEFSRYPSATVPTPAPEPVPEVAELPAVAPVPVLAPVADTWARQARPVATESGSLLERLLQEQADSLPDISLLDTVVRPTPALESADTATANVNPHETIRLPAVFVDSLIDRVVELNVQQVHLSEHFSSMGMDVDELVRTVARLRQQIRTLEVESEARIHAGRSKQAPTTSATPANSLTRWKWTNTPKFSACRVPLPKA